jgi:hypothetical protein
MHGHVDHPDTLVATTRDLGRPGAIAWTEPQLAGTLAQAEAVLVGFAAEPEYVIRTIEQMRVATGRDPIAVISIQSRADFLAQSPELAVATGIDTDPDRYVQMDACEALAETLRVFYRSRFDQIATEAQQRAEQVIDGRWTLEDEVILRLREAFVGRSVDEFLDFLWQGAALADDPDQADQPSLGPLEADLASLLATLSSPWELS